VVGSSFCFPHASSPWWLSLCSQGDPLEVLDNLTRVGNVIGEKYEKDEFL